VGDLIQKKVIEIVSDIMEEPINKISIDTSTDNIDNWDSINQMNLVFALEEEYDVQFSDEQIVGMISVKLILSALSAIK
jgi:acyl carrier protein